MPRGIPNKKPEPKPELTPAQAYAELYKAWKEQTGFKFQEWVIFPCRHGRVLFLKSTADVLTINSVAECSICHRAYPIRDVILVQPLE